ncbi:MAG: hypothetical protein AAGE37_02940 [Pseudomonadota bacterium]
MTKSPVYKRPLFILITTLLIGALIGAAVTGMFVRNRLETARQFTQAEGYKALINNVIAPVTAGQKAQIDPIISRAGKEVEAIFGETRAALNQNFEKMQQELEPHLTPEQLKNLQERREMVRQRFGQ